MPTMERKPAMTVLAMDRESKGIIPASDSIRVLHTPDMREAESAQNVFVLSTDAQLNEVAGFVRAANRRHHLRAFLVREESDPTWIPQLLDEADVRTLRNTIFHSGNQVPKRILSAWASGAQNELIANATVREDRLLVLSCGLELLSLPFSDVKPLARMSPEERSQFEISPDGSYLHWHPSDVDLDLEGVRSVLDPSRREHADRQRLIHDQYFGRTIADLRQQAGQRQGDIKGLSERQVRRIEAGEGTSAAAIGHLARAHNMDVNAYLSRIAERMAQIKSEEAPTKRFQNGMKEMGR
ncbi:MAG TPA: DUF2442 domain-containing protein [Chthonomonadaceae bacterium]|nr:DUF2442 domain-containing protein [Chthonomonadaceae bacterium]